MQNGVNGTLVSTLSVAAVSYHMSATFKVPHLYCRIYRMSLMISSIRRDELRARKSESYAGYVRRALRGIKKKKKKTKSKHLQMCETCSLSTILSRFPHLIAPYRGPREYALYSCEVDEVSLFVQLFDSISLMLSLFPFRQCLFGCSPCFLSKWRTTNRNINQREYSIMGLNMTQFFNVGERTREDWEIVRATGEKLAILDIKKPVGS